MHRIGVIRADLGSPAGVGTGSISFLRVKLGLSSESDWKEMHTLVELLQLFICHNGGYANCFGFFCLPAFTMLVDFGSISMMIKNDFKTRTPHAIPRIVEWLCHHNQARLNGLTPGHLTLAKCYAANPV